MMALQCVFRGVFVIRSMAPINLIVSCPTTVEGQLQLAKRVSDVHAAAVMQRINSLRCPKTQQLSLLDAIIATATASESKKELVSEDFAQL